jgi:hypothetical protein
MSNDWQDIKGKAVKKTDILNAKEIKKERILN